MPEQFPYETDSLEVRTARLGWLQCECEVCGESRPAFLIQLTRHDVSEQVGLDEGALERTVRCCGDRRACLELAEDPQHWRIVPEGFDPWAAFDGEAVVITGDGDTVESDEFAWSEQE